MSALEHVELAKQVRVWSCIDLECAQRHSVSVASHGWASVALVRQDLVQSGMVDWVLGELVEDGSAAETMAVGTSVDCAERLIGRRRPERRVSNRVDLLPRNLRDIVHHTNHRTCNTKHLAGGGRNREGLKRESNGLPVSLEARLLTLRRLFQYSLKLRSQCARDPSSYLDLV